MKDPGAVATDRQTFLDTLNKHNCLRCNKDSALFFSTWTQHECQKCSLAAAGRTTQRALSHRPRSRTRHVGRRERPHPVCGLLAPDSAASRPCTSVYRELIPTLFGLHFFGRSQTKTPGFEFLLASRLRSKALAATLETGGLILTGYAKGDVRLQRAGVDRYFVAVRELRQSMSRHDVDLTTVMLCVVNLQICEAFSCIAAASGGWAVHGAALQQLMRAHGSKPPPSIVQACFSGHTRMFTLWSTLMRRRRVNLSPQFWTRGFGWCNVPTLVTFTAVTMRVPGALEDCDMICRRRATVSLAAVANCIAALAALEGKLHACVRDGCMEMSGRPYWTVKDIPVMHEKIRLEELSKVFPTLYEFPSIHAAELHTNYWMCLLALRQAQLDIRRRMARSRYPSHLPVIDSLDTMTARASECADALCMAVPYLIQARNGYLGMMCAMGPLHMATHWYRRQHDSGKLRWCEAVIEYFDSCGIGTPLTAVETMSVAANEAASTDGKEK